MPDDKKLIIDRHDLRVIREYGIKVFHENPQFEGLQGVELSTLLIAMGMETFLKTKGINVPFEVKVIKKER